MELTSQEFLTIPTTNKSKHINLLLNYYYLENDFDEKISFNKYELSQIKNFETINEFLIYFKKMIKSKRHELSMDIKDNFKPEMFLDSGSGNILKDLSFSKKIAHFTKDKH